MSTRWLLVGMIGCFGGCAAAGSSSVNVYWEPVKKMTPLKTNYTWAPDSLITESFKDRNPGMDDAIRVNIDNVLVEKGFHPGGGSAPGFWVRYGIARGTRQAESGHESWEEAALAVDVLDPRDGKIIWRGWTTTRMDYSRDPESTRVRLEAAIRKIFREFPSVSQRAAAPMPRRHGQTPTDRTGHSP